jgi:hypothetical protein
VGSIRDGDREQAEVANHILYTAHATSDEPSGFVDPRLHSPWRWPHRGQVRPLEEHPGTFSTSYTNWKKKGANLRVLEPAIDTDRPMGRMVLTVLGMVAEMELGFIRDRQRAGIEAAKAKGIYKGRPATFDRARIVALRKEGMGATEIAKAVGCKRGNVYKTLTAAGLNGGNLINGLPGSGRM